MMISMGSDFCYVRRQRGHHPRPPHGTDFSSFFLFMQEHCAILPGDWIHFLTEALARAYQRKEGESKNAREILSTERLLFL